MKYYLATKKKRRTDRCNTDKPIKHYVEGTKPDTDHILSHPIYTNCAEQATKRQKVD